MYLAPAPSILVSVAMCLLAIGMVVFWAWAWAGAHPEESRRSAFWDALLRLDAWLLVTAGLAGAGVLARLAVVPPPLGILVLVGLALTLGFGLSERGMKLARALPLWLLVGFQVFRLPLELVMHRAAQEGIMPVQMSFEGSNHDIVSGALALLVAWRVASGRGGRWLLWGWNLLGFALLVNIVRIAVTSLPMIAAYGEELPRLNTWVAFFPYVWLPTVLVPSALLGHILLTRRLRAEELGA